MNWRAFWRRPRRREYDDIVLVSVPLTDVAITLCGDGLDGIVPQEHQRLLLRDCEKAISSYLNRMEFGISWQRQSGATVTYMEPGP